MSSYDIIIIISAGILNNVSPLNYIKYPQRQNLFFLSFMRLKTLFYCTLKLKNLNTLVEENQRNIYSLMKRWKIDILTTITIHNKDFLNLQ